MIHFKVIIAYLSGIQCLSKSSAYWVGWGAGGKSSVELQLTQRVDDLKLWKEIMQIKIKYIYSRSDVQVNKK